MKSAWFASGLILMMLPGCGVPNKVVPASQPVSGQTAAPVLPDTVTIIRLNPLHQTVGKIPSSITDAKVVQGLYLDLEKLPKPQPTGAPVNCPANVGVTFQLTFEATGRPIGTADVNPSGCGTITFNGTSRATVGPEESRFWSDFSKALGVTNVPLRVKSNTTSFSPLKTRPHKVLIEKNGAQKAITNPTIINALVSKFNQAGEDSKHSMLHCQVMTKDWYRITFTYSNGQTRVFENKGGSCQPMSDVQSGFQFPSGNILTDSNLQ